MSLSTLRSLTYGCAALLISAIAAADAQAVAVAVTKSDNLNHSDTNSAFFTSSATGVTLMASGGWAPSTPTQAAHVTASTPKKTFTIVGDSTAAGNWVDNNGIPAGITLTFDAEFTITGLPEGSYLTNPGGSGGTLGRGIGVTQTFGPTGLNDINLGHGLVFNPVTVSNVSFSGSLADPGFAFTPNSGNVSGFGTVVFRSGNFDETGTAANLDGMVLTQGFDTIGFGTATGSIASNLLMDNNFGPYNQPTPGTSSAFPRQSGPYTFVVTQGVGVIKGMTLEYDVTYDIAAVSAENADFNSDGTVDGADFLLWQQNVDVTMGGTRGQGNANPGADGAVDGTDLDIWKSQFDSTQPIASAVPEPSALLLAFGASLAIAACCRTRRATCR